MHGPDVSPPHILWEGVRINEIVKISLERKFGWDMGRC
jgi:hypothetical protein